MRILGEDLTPFRTEKGEYGLVDDRCPHRCMSLEFGIPEECGLRCAYHGWMFDTKGHCVEMPFEDLAHPELRYKEKIKIKAYPCEALGGFVWAYLGPAPAPLLPRWDVLVRDDLDRAIEIYHAALQLGAVHGQLGRSRCISNSCTRSSAIIRKRKPAARRR